MLPIGDVANDRYVAAQQQLLSVGTKKGKGKGKGKEEKKIEEEKEEKKELEDKRKEEEGKKKLEEKKQKKEEKRKKEEEEKKKKEEKEKKDKEEEDKKKKDEEKEKKRKRRKYGVVECEWAEEVDNGGHECSFGGCAHFHEGEERVDLNPCGMCMFDGKYDTRPGSKWSCVKCSQVCKKQCFSKELR